MSGRIYKVKDGKFTHIKSFPIASSLGNFYTVCTNYLGFKSVEGEYKVMGMAAYGEQESKIFSDSLSFDRKSESIKVGIDLLDSEDITSIYEPAYNREKLSALAGSA